MKSFFCTLIFLPCSFLYGGDFLMSADFDSLKSGYVVYTNNDTVSGNLQMMRGTGKNFVFIETATEGNKKIFIGGLEKIKYGNDTYRIIKTAENSGERFFYAKTGSSTLPVSIYPSYTWLEKAGTTGGSPVFNQGPVSTILEHAWIIQGKEDPSWIALRKTNAPDSSKIYQKQLTQFFSENRKVTGYLKTISHLSFDDIPEVIAHINTLQP